MTTEEFEEKLKEFSDGKITLQEPTVNKINEQTAADFQLLATSIIRITNPTLSKKESENILLNELHF